MTITKENLDEKYRTILTELGGNAAQAPHSMRVIKAVGNGEHRHFHGLKHFLNIANALDDEEDRGSIKSPQIQAVAKHAGLSHDIVYHQVDGFHSDVAQTLQPYIGEITEGAPLASYTLKKKGDPTITTMAKTVFAISEDTIPDVYSGGNELLSAIYAAARGQAEDIPTKYLLAEMAIIEATIPFQKPERMQDLEQRLKNANDRLPNNKKLTNDELADTMHVATHISNIDVIGFRGESGEFAKNTKRLISESANYSQSLEQAKTNQRIFLKDTLLPGLQNGSKTIFHGYAGVPSNETLQEWHDIAKNNITQEITRLAPETKVDGADTSLGKPSKEAGPKLS